MQIVIEIEDDEVRCTPYRFGNRCSARTRRLSTGERGALPASRRSETQLGWRSPGSLFPQVSAQLSGRDGAVRLTVQGLLNYGTARVGSCRARLGSRRGPSHRGRSWGANSAIVMKRR